MTNEEDNFPVVTEITLPEFPPRVDHRRALELLGIPSVKLSNGIRVANFSSPHSFEFVDGTVLPACPPERSRLLALDTQEVEIEVVQGELRFVDLTLKWEMSPVVRNELRRLDNADGYDIMLIPLPVMTAIKESGLTIGRCRCIRRVDRVSNLIHIDRFCL